MFSFLSLEFALLFIGFLAVYWACRAKPQWQNGLLLFFSYVIVFLMAGWTATLLLFAFSTAIYVISTEMSRYPQYRRALLIGGLVAVVANLTAFKYYDFFRSEIAAVLQQLHLDSSGLAANVLLPLGISYYSFQAVSYLVSRYRQDNEVQELNYLQLLLHFSFFATITAGPIARAQSAKTLTDIENQPCALGPQLCRQEKRQLLFPALALTLIAVALIKKWWIAGWLADEWVNPIFANPMQYHSLEVLAAIYAYTVQLYLDFSGYSEMMVAFGLLLGFRLPVNFRAPLLAHNIRVFWDRWHISLSTWIRDYIYIPLGGSRLGFWRTQINLLIAMILSGIWHGYGWNFFLWGLLHGLALVSLNLGDKLYQRMFKVPAAQARSALYRAGLWGKALGVFVTVNFVAFCFVFFRAKTLDEALNVFYALGHNTVNVAWNGNPLYVLTLMCVAWLLYPWVQKVTQRIHLPQRPLALALYAIPLLLIFIVILIFAPSGIPGFIYANF